MRKFVSRMGRGSVAAVALAASLAAFTLQAEAGTAENMERERAILIETLRSADLEA